MVLYRLATESDAGALIPPRMSEENRASVASDSGNSMFSLTSDSKYSTSAGMSYRHARGVVPYAYDPEIDDKDPAGEEDLLHDPTCEIKGHSIAGRGFTNVGGLIGLILGLVAFFLAYPVLSFAQNNARGLAIDGNIRINGTGFQMPELINRDAPDSAKTRTGFDEQDYEPLGEVALRYLASYIISQNAMLSLAILVAPKNISKAWQTNWARVYAADKVSLTNRAKWVRQCLRSRPEATIVLVAHGDILQRITCRADGYSDYQWMNGEVRIFEFDSKTMESEECYLHQRQNMATAGGYARTSTSM